MGRRARRRKIHYTTSGFGDGSVISAGPQRKPSAKKIKERGYHIDEDGVFNESFYSPSEWVSWELHQRVKAVTVLANRINTRRALRELVLPEIAALASTLERIEKRLDAIERSVGNGEAS